jgi:hypothetical protein
MTAVDMLKTLANVSGKVLYYTDANGISFEDLLLTDFTPLDLTSKLIAIKSLKPRFADYDKANIVKYKDDDMTTQQDMISIDYESNAAMLQGEKTLQTLPFSCVSNSRVFVGSETGEYFDRARIVDGNNKKPSADVLLTINANDTFTQRVPLIKNSTIQQLCKEPLTIEATLNMSNYEYSQIQPFSLIHLNGVDYVWTESNWQKNTATLTLSKLPLTLVEPQPIPSPYTYYDYIESTGSQWLDLDYLMTDDTEFEGSFLFSDYDSSKSYNTVIGLSRSGRNNADRLRMDKSSQRLWYGFWRNSAYWANVNLSQLSKISVRGNATTAQIVINASTYNINTGIALPLFDSGGVMANSKLRLLSHSIDAPYDLHKVKILPFVCRKNGVTASDYRPAVRIADGVAGMHDVVNDVFYTNANPAGDNFLYGNF